MQFFALRACFGRTHFSMHRRSRGVKFLNVCNFILIPPIKSQKTASTTYAVNAEIAMCDSFLPTQPLSRQA